MPSVWRCRTLAMQATDLTCMHKVVSPGRDRLSPALHGRTLPSPHLERSRRTLHQPQNSRRVLRAADSDLQGVEPHSSLHGRRLPTQARPLCLHHLCCQITDRVRTL